MQRRPLDTLARHALRRICRRRAAAPTRSQASVAQSTRAAVSVPAAGQSHKSARAHDCGCGRTTTSVSRDMDDRALLVDCARSAHGLSRLRVPAHRHCWSMPQAAGQLCGPCSTQHAESAWQGSARQRGPQGRACRRARPPGTGACSSAKRFFTNTISMKSRTLLVVLRGAATLLPARRGWARGLPGAGAQAPHLSVGFGKSLGLHLARYRARATCACAAICRCRASAARLRRTKASAAHGHTDPCSALRCAQTPQHTGAHSVSALLNRPHLLGLESGHTDAFAAVVELPAAARQRARKRQIGQRAAGTGSDRPAPARAHWTPLQLVQTNMLKLMTTYCGPCARALGRGRSARVGRGVRERSGRARTRVSQTAQRLLSGCLSKVLSVRSCLASSLLELMAARVGQPWRGRPEVVPRRREPGRASNFRSLGTGLSRAQGCPTPESRTKVGQLGSAREH